MGVEYMARQIYQDVITRVTRTEADWKAVCRLAGQIYRYEFDNVLMVYHRGRHPRWLPIMIYGKRYTGMSNGAAGGLPSSRQGH